MVVHSALNQDQRQREQEAENAAPADLEESQWAHTLAGLSPEERAQKAEVAVLRVVRELTGTADGSLGAETPLILV